MGPSLRRFSLAAHIAVSVGWIGAVAAYLALAISASPGRHPATVRAAWIAMELTGWYVIVPLAIAALLTGLLMALGTPWGLFRHYWTLISLALTTFATIILLLHMPTVSSLANEARRASDAELVGLDGDILHPGLGLLVLLVVLALNVYKPSGLTRYGWRKRHEERAAGRAR